MTQRQPPAADQTPAAPRSSASVEQWGTRLGVILAVAGSAVGLGNFLRFPGQAAQNGGGAFMIPYFISLLVLGIPLCWAEWTLGRHAGRRGFHSAPGIFAVIGRHPLAKYAGAIGVMIPLIIYMYYVVIEAWCLYYAIGYLDHLFGDKFTQINIAASTTTGEASGQFWSTSIGANGDASLFDGGHTGMLAVLGTVFCINFVLVYRGISKGIESFCKVAMPLMLVCAVCVLVRVLTLPPLEGHPEQNVVNGLGAMWNPDWSYLQKPKTWLAAAGQIFFSLSVGFGVIINYASYLKDDDDVALSGLTSCSVNEFFEVCLGGMITLPAAFIFLGATAATFGTFGMGFVALPNVFAMMPLGAFFGFLWFFMLFLAAVTSSISMLQPSIAFLEEATGMKRHASVAILGLLAALGTLFVCYFSKDVKALDTLDFWCGTFLIFVFASLQAVLYGFVLGTDVGEQELDLGARLKVPRVVQFVLKYITPLYLLAIFVLFCRYQSEEYLKAVRESPAAQYSLVFAALIGAFLMLMAHIGGKRWQAEKRI